MYFEVVINISVILESNRYLFILDLEKAHMGHSDIIYLTEKQT